MPTIPSKSMIALLLGALAGGAVTAASAGEPEALARTGEGHLTDIRQLTFGGENAEAYWAPDGRELLLQSAHPPFACDQIFRLPIDRPGEMTLVSTGKGRTTCSYFSFPEGDRILYASTHAASEACPAAPSQAEGYVWPIYPEYELYSAKPDGSDLRRMTDNSAYDAEATVCRRDGSIVFTSTRDGDLEIYRMDKDGGNVVRLTHEPGYDGGAFFSEDCTKLVWRASRPRGAALEEYQRLLARHLVRPSRMELWVANADGTEARQVTYLGAASFAPYFSPDGRRILFSSNVGEGRGREFDIWSIGSDGSGLERITTAPGFDGFPIFSPDGTRLAFSSNRVQSAPGETNVYVARWVESPAEPVRGEESAADRIARDVAWLADPVRDGRGVGSAGIAQAASFLEGRFRELGLAPAGDAGGYRQTFEAPVEITAGEQTHLSLGGERISASPASVVPLGFSPVQAKVVGEVVLAGYGITSTDPPRDDYRDLDVRGRIVLVRRFVPAGGGFDGEEAERRYGDLRSKARTAREHGAAALLVVDLPETAPADAGKLPDEAPLPKLTIDDLGDAGIPVVAVSRDVAARLLAAPAVQVEVEVALEVRKAATDNVVARLAAGAPVKRPGTVVIGAHYDHLGFGGSRSQLPAERALHPGADDNGSGTAVLLEAVRDLVARQRELERDVVFVGFSGEELGALGSAAFTRRPPASLAVGDFVAMLNLDMVGRLRGNRLALLGGESSPQWKATVEPLCSELELTCTLSGDGYGPSDQAPFYAAGVPVLHFFTGAHDDYHRPSDTAATINAAGGARVARLVADTTLAVARRPERLEVRAAPAPAAKGDVRATGASLGTVPDFAGDGGTPRPGVLLAAVRAGGPAEKAGIRRGDRLVRLAGREIRDLNDFTFVLRQARPGDPAVAVVEREGRRLELEVIFGEARGRSR